MEFRILGTLQVCDDGREVAIRGAKLRALLAVLLVQANRAISEDVLIDALWGEDASPRAADNLHVLVSRLRRAIGGDRLAREGNGYVLRIQEDELDLDRFELLRREGNPREALELWRGSPLADFTYESWAESEIRRLEELRLVALEERIDNDLAAGRHPELVGELSALIEREPLRENLRRQLIIALYRSGRQAEALEAYRDARRMLDAELGLEPSPALRDLERAVLRQDPSLEQPRSAERIEEPPRRRRRLAVIAASVAMALGFIGAAAAIQLLDRGAGERTAAAAAPEPPQRKPVSAKSKPLQGSTKRVVRSRARPRTSTQAPRKPRTAASPASQQLPPKTTAAISPPPPPQSPQPAQTRRRDGARGRARPQPRPPPPAPPSPPKPVLISDNFDDGVMNRSIWHQILAGSGVELAERNGRLEIAFRADALAGGEYNVIEAHYGTACRFPGDFDARVDFEVLEWPPSNGVLVSLNAWFTNWSAAVGRESRADERYLTWHQSRSNSKPTNDAQGSLRMRRVGTTISTHYMSGGQWQSLGAGESDAAPVIGLQAQSTNEWFGNQPVRVAFDNFVITAEQPVC